MRVAARAWRSLRRLRPEERQVLATQVGLEGAEEILEGLGRGEKRLAPALVLRALEKARKADPSQLRGLVKGLKDRDTRGAILQKWIDSVSDSLGGEEEQEEASGESAGSPAEPEKAPAIPPVEARQPRRKEEAEAVRVIPEKEAPVSIVPEPVAVPVPEPRAKPVHRPPERAQPKRVPPPVPVPVPLPRRRPSPTAAKPAARVAPVPAVSSAPGGGLADRLHRTEGLMARFRVLRSGLERNGGSRLGDVAQLLDAFPAGWARRRALAALLRHHIPGNLEQALAFIDEQESSAARRWCLGTLLDHWELSKEQEDRLRLRRRSGSS
jgi:hypothetical protein